MTSIDHTRELPPEETTSPAAPNSQETGERIRNFFRNPFNGGTKKQPTFFGHLLITSSLLVLIGASNILHSWYAHQQAKKWLNSTEKLTTIDIDKGKSGASATEKARLTEQLDDIQSRLDRYSTMMVFFYTHYYTSIIITSASALVAGICLFFISKVGWERVNNSLINVFVVTSSIGIFFGDLPGTFKYKENSETSRDLYLEHISLKNEVRSYLVTGLTISDNAEDSAVYKRTETNLFIHYVDQKLASLNEIPLGFDTTGINDFKDNAERLSIPEKPKPSR